MPRTTRKQTTIRAGAGDTQVSMPQSPISSPAPYVNYVHISPDQSAGRSELRIGEALAGFGDTVANIAVRQREADAKRRRLQGQADAYTQGAPENWGLVREAILNDPDKGPEYLKAFTKQGAALAAVSKSNDLADQLAKRTDIDSVQKFNQWFAENTANDLQVFADLDDPETTLTYAARLEDTELSLKAAVQKRAADKAYTETETNFNMVVQQEIEDAVGRNVRGSELLQILTEQRKNGQAVLLNSEDINQAQIRAVGELAASEGRPELLNIFDYSRPDSNDPEKTVPGLAFSREHGADIDSYRQKANKEHDARVSEALKQTQYAAEKRAQDYLDEGETEKLEVFTDLMVEQGVFTPATGIGYYKAAHKVDVKKERIARNLNNIITGRSDIVPAHERGEAMDAYYDRMTEKAAAIGTPQAFHEATKDVLITGASIGAMPKAFEAKVKDLNVVDPEQFASTIQLTGVMEAISPTLYYDNVSPSVRAQIDHATRMMEGGRSQEEVMALMQEMRTPEGVAKRKAAAGDSKQQAQRLSGIKSNLDLDDDVVNREEAAQWVADTALDYLVQTDTDNYNDALKYAKKQYEASFAKVKLGGGAGYVSIYKGNLGLPSNIEDQFQWFSENFTKEMQDANPGLDTGISFYLVPDASSRFSEERQFIVRDSLGRTHMEVRDGLAVPMRVGQQELERDWRIGYMKEAESEQAKKQAERLRRNARALRNRRYYGVDGDVLRQRYRDSKRSPEGEPDISPVRPQTTPEPLSELPPNLQQATDLVAKYEGFRGEAYAATQAEADRGIWTIGYGTTEGVAAGSKMTEAQAKDALAEQVQKTSDAVAAAVGPYWDELNDAQQAVVISLAYNVDKDVVGQFKRSRALRALRNGDLETFKLQAFDPEVGFVKQTQKDGTKKVVPGLVNRRRDELRRFNEASKSAVAGNI